MPNLGTHLSPPVKYTAKKENSNENEWFSNMSVGTNPDVVKWMQDFVVPTDFNTTDWTATEVGSGSQAVGTSSNASGILLLTTGSANGPDSESIQPKSATWILDATVGANNAFLAGKRLWFEASVEPSNVATVDMFVGLAAISTT